MYLSLRLFRCVCFPWAYLIVLRGCFSCPHILECSAVLIWRHCVTTSFSTECSLTIFIWFFFSLRCADAGEEFFEHDAEEFLVFLTLLITEGRTPECSVKGRTEGLHCPPAQSAQPVTNTTKHECSDKLPQVRMDLMKQRLSQSKTHIFH